MFDKCKKKFSFSMRLSTDFDKNIKSEMRLPPFADIFNASFRIPFFLYFILFQTIGYYIRKYAWKNYSGFRFVFVKLF